MVSVKLLVTMPQNLENMGYPNRYGGRLAGRVLCSSLGRMPGGQHAAADTAAGSKLGSQETLL
jgi:hypothetical protein